MWPYILDMLALHFPNNDLSTTGVNRPVMGVNRLVTVWKAANGDKHVRQGVNRLDDGYIVALRFWYCSLTFRIFGLTFRYCGLTFRYFTLPFLLWPSFVLFWPCISDMLPYILLIWPYISLIVPYIFNFSLTFWYSDLALKKWIVFEDHLINNISGSPCFLYTCRHCYRLRVLRQGRAVTLCSGRHPLESACRRTRTHAPRASILTDGFGPRASAHNDITAYERDTQTRTHSHPYAHKGGGQLTCLASGTAHSLVGTPAILRWGRAVECRAAEEALVAPRL
jgi:hypothetical protein